MRIRILQLAPSSHEFRSKDAGSHQPRPVPTARHSSIPALDFFKNSLAASSLDQRLSVAEGFEVLRKQHGYLRAEVADEAQGRSDLHRRKGQFTGRPAMRAGV